PSDSHFSSLTTTPPPTTPTLPLHDALPISRRALRRTEARPPHPARKRPAAARPADTPRSRQGRARRAEGAETPSSCPGRASEGRSEEHTSELQSLTNLVCRLLLEKKKKDTT